MQWKPVGVDDYPHLAPFFLNQPYRLCAYGLASIIVWSNQINESLYAFEGDTLIIANRVNPRPDDSYLLLPVAPRRDFGPVELATIARRAEIPQFWYVPQDYLDAFGREAVADCFQIEEQCELHDYLYRTEDLALLKGNRYAGKRNWINRFGKAYRERILVEPIIAASAEECLVFLEAWCQANDCGQESNEGLYCEKQAAIEALKNIDRLGLYGILVRIDGKVEAFGICSGLTEDIGVLSFEKANANIEGLYQFLDNECAKRLFSAYRFINKESDMGLPGLVKSKQSYHPVEIVKSYCLTLKEQRVTSHG